MLLQKLAQLESKLAGLNLQFGQTSYQLTFRVNDGAIVTDSTTGIQSFTPTEYVVTALLTQAKSQTRNLQDLELPGVNASSIAVEGFCIAPSFLPASIRPYSTGKVKYLGPNGWEAPFLLLPSLQNDQTIERHHIRGYIQIPPSA